MAGTAKFHQALDMSSKKITSLADPASAQDAATKAYVDAGASVITSGALPTVTPVSGTAFQCSTSRSVFLVVPVTFNPTALLTATCLVELSPDNTTFSTLVTKTLPALAGLLGLIDEVAITVPKSWRVRLTVTNATLGAGTYY